MLFRLVVSFLLDRVSYSTPWSVLSRITSLLIRGWYSRSQGLRIFIFKPNYISDRVLDNFCLLFYKMKKLSVEAAAGNTGRANCGCLAIFSPHKVFPIKILLFSVRKRNGDLHLGKKERWINKIHWGKLYRTSCSVIPSTPHIPNMATSTAFLVPNKCF